MTDAAHQPTAAELEDVFRPADRPPLRHHRNNCECDPEAIIVDLVWGSGVTPKPDRTVTACTATGCTCPEYKPGAVRDGWRHCGNSCQHTDFSHGAVVRPKIKKAAKR